MQFAPTPLAFRGRIGFLALLVAAGFLMVLAGYYRVQVLEQDKYERLGEKYRIKKARVKAPRGLIYDRNKQLITRNMPTYNLTLLRDEMSEPWRTFKRRAAAFLCVTESLLDDQYKKRSHLLSAPVLLLEDIGYQESLRIMRHKRRFPGFSIETTTKRFYTRDELLTHVLGYVGEASPEHLQKNKKLHMGDIVGKSGVELFYDHNLIGEDGERTIQIDSKGVYRSVELTQPPEPGDDLYLTLDLELQQLAVDELDGHAGSILMMDVQTGRILIYVSSPSYNLNWFTSRISNEQWNSLLNAPAKPFLNRPIQGAYAPGSVFKLVTAMAALKHRKITLDTRYFCNGSIKLYNHEFKCHNSAGHGWVDMTGAIQASCNVYFWTVALDLSADDLAQAAFDLGLGKPTGIDLEGEKGGLVPTPTWKRENMKEPWFPGDTLNTSIGQGNLLATPLQIVRLMGVLATEGTLVTPHLLEKTREEGDRAKIWEPNKVEGFSETHFQAVKQAMWMVVNNTGGTGSGARVAGYDVCGKTGTAQLKTFTSDEEHDMDELKNAWFAGFAPKKNPEIAVMVLVEHAGSGGKSAAPIAKALFQAYQKRKKEKKVNPS